MTTFYAGQKDYIDKLNTLALAADVVAYAALEADLANINAVASDLTSIDAVAANETNISTAATNIVAIIAAPTEASNAAVSAATAQTLFNRIYLGVY